MKRIFFAFNVALLALVSSPSASAAIIYSGLQNIPIPTNLGGVYLNLDTKGHSTSPITGWDVNPFYGGAGIAYETTFLPLLIGTGQDAPIAKLSVGALIGAGLNYATTYGV